jgi:acyl-CoA synthetase (AMP-forming)/AMP-acid ligase II
VPKSVELVDELPRNALGKVEKKLLRERYWGGRERSVA